VTSDSSTRLIRIGTRGSRLALAQAHEVRDRLMAAHGIVEADVEIRIIRTTGDRIVDRPLAEAGGKGLFTKEIEEALLAGEIDVAVHSMKDMPTVLPDGLGIVAMLEREDPRDAFISPVAATFAELRQGAVVGSSSLRRGAQLLRRRPDLRIVNFRGNVETRLRKLGEGVVDATLLACAGLNRLGRAADITSVIETADMLPAVAQGAIGIEARLDDQRVGELLAPLHHRQTGCTVAAERAFLAVLDGSCRTPIAALAELDHDGRLRFRGMILTPDGTECHETERTGDPDDAEWLGEDAGLELRDRAGPHFWR